MWKKNNLLLMDRLLVPSRYQRTSHGLEVNTHIKEEVASPKSEPTALEEESDEQNADDQNSDALREDLQRSRDAFPLHDPEDSLGPEQVADELSGSQKHTHK